jgi:hypothetical protein
MRYVPPGLLCGAKGKGEKGERQRETLQGPTVALDFISAGRTPNFDTMFRIQKDRVMQFSIQPKPSSTNLVVVQS